MVSRPVREHSLERAPTRDAQLRDDDETDLFDAQNASTYCSIE